MANGRCSAALDQSGASARVDRAGPHEGGSAQTRSPDGGCATPVVILASATCDRSKQFPCLELRLARGPPLPDDPHRSSQRNPDEGGQNGRAT